MAGEDWDKRYSEEGFAYGKIVNRFLLEHAGAFPEGGKILLPAEGEGRNAVALAKGKFSVTCFDQSSVGMRKAEKLAKKAGVEIDAQVSDAMNFPYGEAIYDGAALIFAHFPPKVRMHVHASVVKALKPGAIILMEAFRPDQLHYSSGGPKERDMLYTEDMLRADFSACREVRVESTETELNEGSCHKGRAAVIRMIAWR